MSFLDTLKKQMGSILSNQNMIPNDILKSEGERAGSIDEPKEKVLENSSGQNDVAGDSIFTDLKETLSEGADKLKTAAANISTTEVSKTPDNAVDSEKIGSTNDTTTTSSPSFSASKNLFSEEAIAAHKAFMAKDPIDSSIGASKELYRQQLEENVNEPDFDVDSIEPMPDTTKSILNDTDNDIQNLGNFEMANEKKNNEDEEKTLDKLVADSVETTEDFTNVMADSIIEAESKLDDGFSQSIESMSEEIDEKPGLSEIKEGVKNVGGVEPTTSDVIGFSKATEDEENNLDSIVSQSVGDIPEIIDDSVKNLAENNLDGTAAGATAMHHSYAMAKDSDSNTSGIDDSGTIASAVSSFELASEEKVESERGHTEYSVGKPSESAVDVSDIDTEGTNDPVLGSYDDKYLDLPADGEEKSFRFFWIFLIGILALIWAIFWRLSFDQSETSSVEGMNPVDPVVTLNEKEDPSLTSHTAEDKKHIVLAPLTGADNLNSNNQSNSETITNKRESIASVIEETQPVVKKPKSNVGIEEIVSLADKPSDITNKKVNREAQLAMASPVDAITDYLNKEDYDDSVLKGFILYGLNFRTASSQVSAESAQIVTDIATMMNQYPKVKIRLEGHTDNRGNELSNKALSASRARAVKQRLVKLKINPERIMTDGLGQEYPIMDNGTRVGRLKNRRVEIVITER